MNSEKGDEIYGQWMTNWRKWKFAWCESDEPVILFYIKFICKNGIYTNKDYGDLCSYLETCIGKTHIDRDGILNINSKNIGTNITIEIVKINDKYVDRFGIVTFKLNMFLRKYIIILCKTLEFMGHGLIHNNGIVVSSDYNNDHYSPSKLPERDDPVWIINHPSLLE